MDLSEGITNDMNWQFDDQARNWNLMAGKSSKDCSLDGIKNFEGVDIQPADEMGWKIV